MTGFEPETANHSLTKGPVFPNIVQILLEIMLRVVHKIFYLLKQQPIYRGL